MLIFYITTIAATSCCNSQNSCCCYNLLYTHLRNPFFMIKGFNNIIGCKGNIILSNISIFCIFSFLAYYILRLFRPHLKLNIGFFASIRALPISSVQLRFLSIYPKRLSFWNLTNANPLPNTTFS